MSGTEPIILVPTSRDYPPIVTVPASPTMDQDRPDETLYSRASPLVQATGDIGQPTLQDISPAVSGEEPIILAPARRDYLLIITVTARSNMDQDTSDIEQPTSLASTDQLRRYTRVNLTYI